MSRGHREAKAKVALSPEDRRARDVRRGFLLVHALLSGILVLGASIGWYTILHGQRVLAAVQPLGRDAHGAPEPFAVDARWLILCAVVAFFFTSYDLVANADFQWPPLLASAFALGCCGHVAYRLDRDVEVLVDRFVKADMIARIQQEKAARARAGLPPAPDVATIASALAAPAPPASGVAGVGSAVAPVASGAGASVTEEPPVRLQVNLGLKLCLFASASMTLLSTYLTFFARRAP